MKQQTIKPLILFIVKSPAKLSLCPHLTVIWTNSVQEYIDRDLSY